MWYNGPTVELVFSITLVEKPILTIVIASLIEYPSFKTCSYKITENLIGCLLCLIYNCATEKKLIWWSGGRVGTIPAVASMMWLWEVVISAQRKFAGVGVQQIPRERASAFIISVHAIGGGVLHLQPNLVSHVEVEDHRVACGGWDGSFCYFSHRVEIAEQADFKWFHGN